eukprot:COSAG02_NODE_6181_length_3747_cov_398.343750_3_plen_27_part_01
MVATQTNGDRQTIAFCAVKTAGSASYE